MPESPVPVLSPSLEALIEGALQGLPSAHQGSLSSDVSLTGFSVTASQRLGRGLLAGYAERLWGGGWTAGARFQLSW